MKKLKQVLFYVSVILFILCISVGLPMEKNIDPKYAQEFQHILGAVVIMCVICIIAPIVVESAALKD